ncbi:undecaprenyl-phosphate glucose phosphotransferase [Marinobacter hydrocarbonoclasticus]|nr:undecaprenyl-phosphate glucose phosphotransferase [Marinobacter nauticus]
MLSSIHVLGLVLGHTIELEEWVATLSAIIMFGFFAELQKLYLSWRTTRFRQEASMVSFNWLFAISTVAVFESAIGLPLIEPPKLWVAWGFGTWLMLLSYRIAARKFLASARKAGFNQRRVVIAGQTQLAKNLVQRIRNAPWMGLEVIGCYSKSVAHNSACDVPSMGDLDQLIADAKERKFDKVYITLPMTEEAEISRLVRELADSTCTVYFLPDIFTYELLHSRSENIAGLPAISIYESPTQGVNGLVKRLFDVVVGSIILALIAIPMLLIALAVKITSKGPVFFKQNRYGIDGTPIKVWKFRSMTVMEDGDKVTQAKKGDNRLTPIGGFLRRSSLDELPQFINVLQGSMSIVGPRPHAVAHNEEYRKLVNGYMLRHKVKPGITGWAQINGWRGETDTLEKMEKRIEFDLDYICNWSVLFDAKIVFLTIFKGFFNKNAY